METLESDKKEEFKEEAIKEDNTNKKVKKMTDYKIGGYIYDHKIKKIYFFFFLASLAAFWIQTLLGMITDTPLYSISSRMILHNSS